MILISSTEPSTIKTLGRSSQLPERFGVDILWGTETRLIGIQRKEMSDLLASVHGDRLYREVAQMKRLSHSILIIEGKPKWTRDGNLIGNNGYGYAWNRDQHWGLQLSMQAKGVWVLHTEDINQTVDAVKAVKRWMGKARHNSLDRRPKATGSWGKAGHRDFQRHLLQSFDGIGPVQAEAIVDKFGGVPMQWTTDEKGLMEVEGIGKTRAKRLMDAL